MAHKGRAYPLTNHRGLTADAPYPYWAARGYEISYPGGATGTFAAALNNRIVRAQDPIMASGYLFYENITPFFPGLTELRTILRIGWTNVEPNLRLFQIVSFFVTVLPIPSSQLLATWQYEAPERLDTGLAQSSVPFLSAPNPSDYDPQTRAASFLYIPWSGF